MSFGGIKRTAADHWFSFYIRFRDNWTCRACGKSCPRRKYNNPDLEMVKMDCAHIFGRAAKSVRLCEQNALTLCFNCHNKFSDDSTEWKKFVIGIIGQQSYDLLTLKKNIPMHGFKQKEPMLRDHYKKLVEQIAARQGKTWIIQ